MISTNALGLGMSMRQLLGIAVLVAWSASSVPLSAAPPAVSTSDTAPADANELSLQVLALRTIHEFGLNARQLRELETLATGSAKNGKRKEGKITPKLRTAFLEAREAFLKGDAMQIEELDEALTESIEKEEMDLDDEIHLTDAARRRASDAVGLMTPKQITAYFGNFRDDVPDVAELLADAVVRGRKLKGAEWTELRDDTADEVARLAAGVDRVRADKVRDRVTLLLNTARNAAGEPPGRAEFDREVRSWLGPDANWVVLRNSLQLEAAELLANPQLSIVIRARLQKMEK